MLEQIYIRMTYSVKLLSKLHSICESILVASFIFKQALGYFKLHLLHNKYNPKLSESCEVIVSANRCTKGNILTSGKCWKQNNGLCYKNSYMRPKGHFHCLSGKW
jgi:hypothetical protein